jgi:hypothetical protein
MAMMPRVGATAEIYGLVMRPDLNGQLVRVCEDGDPVGQRWECELTGTRTRISIKTSNLRILRYGDHVDPEWTLVQQPQASQQTPDNFQIIAAGPAAAGVAGQTPDNLHAMAQRTAADNGYVTDQWVDLPLGGAGQICLRHRRHAASSSSSSPSSPPLPLAFFDAVRSRDLAIVFRNHRYATEEIVMEYADILKVCPANVVWVYCQACRKFCYPAAMHRASGRHQRHVADPWGVEDLQRWHSRALTGHEI